MTKREQKIADLWDQYQAAHDQAKAAADKEKLLKGMLTEYVSPGKTEAGIRHDVRQTKSISYAKALPHTQALIPKSKQPEVTVILDNFTSTSEAHTLRPAKD